MGTTIYFDEEVKNSTKGEEVHIECGTTGYAGEGPQLYLKWNGEGIILSHADAEKFCSAIASLSRYFSYKDVD